MNFDRPSDAAHSNLDAAVTTPVAADLNSSVCNRPLRQSILINRVELST
jgi:hypothetical protein